MRKNRKQAYRSISEAQDETWEMVERIIADLENDGIVLTKKQEDLIHGVTGDVIDKWQNLIFRLTGLSFLEYHRSGGKG